MVFAFMFLSVILCLNACKTKKNKRDQEDISKNSPISAKLSATDSIYKVGKVNGGYFILEIKNNTINKVENFSFRNNITFYAHCEKSLAPLHLNIFNDIILSMVKAIVPNGFFQTTIKFDDLFRDKIPVGKVVQMNTGWYWTWMDKMDEPPTPLHIDKDNLCKEVFFWYKVKIYGKEYLSNKVKLQILK